ncbi:hypothetical protein L211DRAFT_842363 [Terfezia boudieri ATCC MYA-4762]|uniref:Uncharacterized protein n=1 Tax=Terfezia boudieri ATCC MYA-4762 TaxID=1051890 RepID=A0A3N4LDI1_9PEZI|nr:hypothetical protein L211DRAFT_842363 [Terfezia boudieri ATCC MYA-4762]
MSGSMQVSMNQEAQVMEHPVSGGEGLMNLNPPAPGTWRFPVSTDFASQASDFEYSGASGHFPGIQSQFASPPARQHSGQSCPQNIGSSLVACPWRSHLEMIMSIDLDISLLQNETSTTMEPSLREGLGVLLGHLVELKRSYFTLQDSVQPSKPGNLLR